MKILCQAFTLLLCFGLASTTTSAVAPLYGDMSVIVAFVQYLAKPNEKSYFIFKDLVGGYYERSPIECLKLLERHQTNWTFIYMFWRALKIASSLLDHRNLSAMDFYRLLLWILQEIRRIFKILDPSNEPKVKESLEMVTILIKVVERSTAKLKLLGIEDHYIYGLEESVKICKFLVKNISMDFPQKTIDFDSLFRVLNEIKVIKLSHNPKLHQSELFALLWIYMHHIWTPACMKIFDFYTQDCILIFDLILSCRDMFDGFYFCQDFYPHSMIFRLRQLKENGFAKFMFIGNLLMEFKKPLNFCKLLRIPREITSFLELARFIEYNPDTYDSYTPITIWKLRALAKLEQHLTRYGV